jgi:hypothetical protein
MSNLNLSDGKEAKRSPSPDLISTALNPCSPEQSDFSMSPTGQSTSSTSNLQLIIDALADYAKITGIDLSKNPFAAALEQSNSPEAILQLLQGREKGFKEYRDGNRKLINCLSPAVKVLQAFSGILGGAVSLVSHTSHLVSLLFNVTSPGPLPTSKCFACWVRCPPCCTFLEYALQTIPF